MEHAYIIFFFLFSFNSIAKIIILKMFLMEKMHVNIRVFAWIQRWHTNKHKSKIKKLKNKIITYSQSITADKWQVCDEVIEENSETMWSVCTFLLAVSGLYSFLGFRNRFLAEFQTHYVFRYLQRVRVWQFSTAHVGGRKKKKRHPWLSSAFFVRAGVSTRKAEYDTVWATTML